MRIGKGSLALILIAATAVGAWFLLRSATAPRGLPSSQDAINPTDDPIREPVENAPPIPLKFKDADLSLLPKASYRLTARIGSKRRYRSSWEGQAAPYDLVLMWGRLAAEDPREYLTISQDMRWYRFRLNNDAPVSVDYVSQHSANTHIIPATKNLRRAVARLRSGDEVRMEGFLVFLSGTYKGQEVWWNSSLTPQDTGAGACEVFYLESLAKEGRLYR